jgi:hypothetical protein
VHHSKIDRQMAEMVKTDKTQNAQIISGLPPEIGRKRAGIQCNARRF